MSRTPQSVLCPACSFVAPLDLGSAGRAMVCEECRAVFLAPECLLEGTHAQVSSTHRVRLAPDGTWTHVDCGTVELTAKAIPHPEAAAPPGNSPLPTTGPTPSPDKEPQERPQWSVGIQMGKIPAPASEEASHSSAPREKAGAEQMEPGTKPAACKPTQRGAASPQAPEEELATAFANLPWYVDEETTRRGLEGKGYNPAAREEHENVTIQHFRGKMGSQEMFLSAEFGTDQCMQRLSIDIVVDPRVQRDLFLAMVGSLDEKYGSDCYKDQEGSSWSAAWLVHGGSALEWSVAAQEQIEAGRHLVSVHYLSPRVHASQAGGVSPQS